LDCRQ
jgi:hypothetical protein